MCSLYADLSLFYCAFWLRDISRLRQQLATVSDHRVISL